MSKPCPCGSGLPRRDLTDARGIYCTVICDECEDVKRSAFRFDVFEDPQYWADEPICEDYP